MIDSYVAAVGLGSDETLTEAPLLWIVDGTYLKDSTIDHIEPLAAVTNTSAFRIETKGQIAFF